MAKKRNINEVLDLLLDEDGLKTEVTITMTSQTLIKLIIALLLSGMAILVIANLVKNAFPNTQLESIEKTVSQIKQTLKS